VGRDPGLDCQRQIWGKDDGRWMDAWLGLPLPAIDLYSVDILPAALSTKSWQALSGCSELIMMLIAFMWGFILVGHLVSYC
jgi:hypothetical protein